MVKKPHSKPLASPQSIIWPTKSGTARGDRLANVEVSKMRSRATGRPRTPASAVSTVVSR